MKVFTVNLNEEDIKYKDIKEIKIIVIADAHIGDPLLDEKLLKETINYIKENDNVFCILNGDLMNTAIKSSVSDVYSETMSPMQQIEELVRLLEPIKNKILCATAGNHERRIEKETSIDIMNIAMKELGLGHRYTNNAFYLYLYFGEKEQGRKAPMVYTLFSYHGNGGGRKSGGKLNRVVDMSNTCIADVYIMSHVHEPIGTKKAIYLPDYPNKALTKKEMLFTISNSYLNYGGYASQYGYNPSSTSRIEIILNGKTRESKLLM